MKAYTPKTYSGRVILFKAMMRESYVIYSSDAPEIGWRKFVDKLEIHEVPGEHISILQEPCVQVVAEKLRDYLI